VVFEPFEDPSASPKRSVIDHIGVVDGSQGHNPLASITLRPAIGAPKAVSMIHTQFEKVRIVFLDHPAQIDMSIVVIEIEHHLGRSIAQRATANP